MTTVPAEETRIEVQGQSLYALRRAGVLAVMKFISSFSPCPFCDGPRTGAMLDCLPQLVDAMD